MPSGRVARPCPSKQSAGCSLARRAQTRSRGDRAWGLGRTNPMSSSHRSIAGGVVVRGSRLSTRPDDIAAQSADACLQAAAPAYWCDADSRWRPLDRCAPNESASAPSPTAGSGGSDDMRGRLRTCGGPGGGPARESAQTEVPLRLVRHGPFCPANPVTGLRCNSGCDDDRVVQRLE